MATDLDRRVLTVEALWLGMRARRRRIFFRVPGLPGREYVYPALILAAIGDIDCGDDALTLPTFVMIGAMKAGP